MVLIEEQLNAGVNAKIEPLYFFFQFILKLETIFIFIMSENILPRNSSHNQ